MEFNRELRSDLLAGDITLSVRLWTRAPVKQGGRYRVGPEIEVDAIELVRSPQSPGRTSDEPASLTAIRSASAPRTPGRSRRTRSANRVPRGELR